VATLVLLALHPRRTEGTHPHQLVVGRQEGPLHRARFGSGHVLPAAVGEEAMVTAGDQFGAVFKRDSVARLASGPVGAHLGCRVAAVVPSFHRSVDRVADLQVGDGLRTPISQQNRRTPVGAVDTGMSASPVWIDRPAEAEAVAGDVVEGGAGGALGDG